MKNIENLIITTRHIKAKDVMSKEIKDIIEGCGNAIIDLDLKDSYGVFESETTCNPDMLESAIDNDDFEEEDEATIQKLRDVVKLCKDHNIDYIVMNKYSVNGDDYTEMENY